jgi:hypothetical protein
MPVDPGPLAAAPQSMTARAGPFERPMADDARSPSPVLLAREDEAADRQLAALVVAVEQIDRQQLAGEERLAQAGAEGIVGLANRPLPEAGVAGGDVQITRLLAMLGRLGVR